MGVIGDIHFLRNLRFWTLGHVQNARLAFDEGPFKTLFTTVHVNALAVLPGDVGATKPDPRPFEAALRALEVSPEQAVYVGDDPTRDFEGARRAGLATFDVTTLASVDELPARLATLPHSATQEPR